MDLQRDALQKTGCDIIYEETKSGRNTERPELNHCVKALPGDDTLVVWRLDRLGRSLSDLVRIIAELELIPLRTLKKRFSKGQRWSVDKSDRLFRIAHITAIAQIVFGDRDKAKRWLSKPKGRFNDQTPTMLLLTLPSTCLVEEMLRQIAEGYSF